MSAAHLKRAARGFSLVEVLVALIIIAVGMLGLAKLQGLTYSSTSTSAMRSIAALQASSLAAFMHANRAYWSVVPNGFTYQFAGAAGTPTSSDSSVATSSNNCTSAACGSAALVAAADLASWRTAVITALPGPTASVACQSVSPNPVSCTIQLTWAEGNLSANSNSQGNTQANSASAPYQLYVVP